MRTRAIAITAAGVLAVGGAGTALAYTGTSLGKKVAGEMLASYKHVHYLAGSHNGNGVVYCAGNPEGVYVGPANDAPAACRGTPGTQSWVETLANGVGVSAVGRTTAGGKPAISFVTTKSGTFWRAAGASCWQHSPSPDSTFVGSPPFGYFPKEYMTVTGMSGGNILLSGTVTGHLKEVDTISASTHEIVGEDIHFLGPYGFVLHTHYHNASAAPVLPDTTPAC
jgi:hypothetical protein